MPARAFARRVDLPGWSIRSIWGYDETFECYWAELRRDDDRAHAPGISIGCHHLIPTSTVLSRVIADQIGIDENEVWLALVGPSQLEPHPRANRATRGPT
jgi:hypothetical protein